MRKGLTVVEAILALFVTALVVLTIASGLKSTHFEMTTKTDQQLAWHYFLSEVRSPKYAFVVEKVETNYILLESSIQKKTFILKFRSGELVLTTPKGGYIPLMRGLKTGQFQAVKKGVDCEAMATTGQRFKANLMLEDENDK
ncbi:competence type IV pilus minor pilin ComGF [uncultured Secundilactobacillus sp.]|uniref:competence type IV pilus minor pilin ComGF n=1 Tax=uncultured Secundilactobacillus sp. TaxID=2813935 RepID=UPI002590E57C|nr:competence type IV pilus minor pilin ComGF [uncultured Secundilactobacillus sp.]